MAIWDKIETDDAFSISIYSSIFIEDALQVGNDMFVALAGDKQGFSMGKVFLPILLREEDLGQFIPAPPPPHNTRYTYSRSVKLCYGDADIIYAFCIEKILLSASGISDQWYVTNEFGKYTISTKKWENLGKLRNEVAGTRRVVDSFFYAGNKLYLIGGSEFDYDPYVDYDKSDAITVYDISTKQTTHYRNRIPKGYLNGARYISIDNRHYIATRNGVHEFSPAQLAVNRISGALNFDIKQIAQTNGEIYMLGSDYQLHIFNLNNRLLREGPTFENYINVPMEGAIYKDRYYAISLSQKEEYSKLVWSVEIDNTKLTNIAPMAGFVNEQEPNTFSWELVTTPEDLGQKSATVQWRPKGSTTVYSINIVGQSQSLTIPAGTFPNGAIQWRVRAISGADIPSDWSDWYDLTTVDIPHEKPVNLYPHGGKADGTKSIQLSWLVRSLLNTPQKGFEMQVNYNPTGQVWQNLTKSIVQSASSTYEVSPGTFAPDKATGFVQWRVRTYNSDMQVSPWSDPATFTVIDAPDPPRWIGVEKNRSRPLCKWELQLGQIAWRLRIYRGTNEVIYDTGERNGTDTSHKIADYLDRGEYTFKLAVKNELGLWSEYSPLLVNISGISRVRIDIAGEQVENGARIVILDKEVIG